MKKKLLSILLILLLTLSLLPLSASAAASVSVRASSSSVKVGDTITVSVTFSAKNIGVVDASFSYNSGVLQYVSGSNTSNGKIVLYASSSGQSSLSTSIQFKAVGSGSTNISVSSSQIYSFDEQSLGSASGSAKVTVSSSSVSPTNKPTTKPTSKPTNKPTTKPTSKPTNNAGKPTSTPSKSSPSLTNTPSGSPTQSQPSDLSVDIDEKNMKIAPDLEGVDLPKGAALSKADYKGTQVDCASKFGLTLLYLTDENDSGDFYVFLSGELLPYVELSQVSSHIILPPSALQNEDLPKGLSPAQLTIDNSSFKGWVDDENNYIIYALDASGEKGFFRYDYSERRLIKYDAVASQKTSSNNPQASPTKSQPGDSDSIQVDANIDQTPKSFIDKISSDIVFASSLGALIVLCFAMLIVFICTVSKRNKKVNSNTSGMGKHQLKL